MKSALVIGGSGFIGTHLCRRLLARGISVTVVDPEPPQADVPYSEHFSVTVEELFSDARRHGRSPFRCDVVYCLAALVRGVWYNSTFPVLMLERNAHTAIAQLLYAAYHTTARRIVYVSSSCVYGDCAGPIHEGLGFVGNIAPSNSGYGYAKRLGERLCQVLRQEGTTKEIAIVRPANVYGPGDSGFVGELEDAHVIPALIRKATRLSAAGAGEPLVVWGSGEQERSFIHARDLARFLELLGETELPAGVDPVFNATGESATIGAVARLLRMMIDPRLEIVYDTSKPGGPLRRVLDGSKARDLLGFSASCSLEEGLRETVAWYNDQHHHPRL